MKRFMDIGVIWLHAGRVEKLADGTIMFPGKWYHSDETQNDAYGPFDTSKEAFNDLEAYCRWLGRAK